MNVNVNRAIMLDFPGKNIHITVCYLENIPATDYQKLLSDIKRNWGPQVSGNSNRRPGKTTMWNLMFVNKWGQNSMNVFGVSEDGIVIENMRIDIFNYVAGKYGKYISKKWSKTGYVQTHIDIQKLKHVPSNGETWKDLEMQIK